MMTNLRPLLLGSVILMPAWGFAAEDSRTVAEISWQARAETEKLRTGTVVEDESLGPVLKIEAEGDQPVTTLVEIERPKITSLVYGIEGRVRYEDVGETGFLELWNHFPDGSAYFTRTQEMSGPLQSLKGRSGWRDFSLPFSREADPSAPPPSKLTFNVVLPKGGTVWLSDITLKEYPNRSLAATARGAWWDNRTGGYLGSILGTLLGLLGAVIGTLGGMGRARGLVTVLHIGGIVVGVIFLAVGLVALVIGQPYEVYYPLLGIGFIATVVLGSLYPVVQRGYEQRELRRMQAVDA